ncbi:MAG: CrcB family protein [Actinomycetota bacterium]|nr:CrcB family protein [Actinomycetota bacterium]
MIWLLIGVMGALGALARYGVSGIVQRRWQTSFPIGTVVVNLTGAFGAGLLLGIVTGRVVPNLAVAAVGIGFLGGYSTFSTWMVETVLAAESGGRSGIRRAAKNVMIPMIGGVVAVWIGFVLGGLA